MSFPECILPIDVLKNPFLALVYVILDPETLTISYVGKSKHGRVRVNDHQASLRSGRHKNRKLQGWFDALTARGISPAFGVLEVCPDRATLCQREAYWISRLAGEGYPLLNDAISKSAEKTSG